MMCLLLCNFSAPFLSSFTWWGMMWENRDVKIRRCGEKEMRRIIFFPDHRDIHSALDMGMSLASRLYFEAENRIYF
jgi:hypothetical protein